MINLTYEKNSLLECHAPPDQGVSKFKQNLSNEIKIPFLTWLFEGGLEIMMDKHMDTDGQKHGYKLRGMWIKMDRHMDTDEHTHGYRWTGGYIWIDTWIQMDRHTDTEVQTP